MKRIIGVIFSTIVFFSLAIAVSAASVTENEPNNTRKNADIVQFNNAIIGNLSTAADVDFFKVNVATPGELRVKIKNASNSIFDVTVYSEVSGEMDAIQTANTNIGTSQLNIGVNKGVHFIKISWNKSSNKGSGSYSFDLEIDTELKYEREHNNNVKSATEVVLNDVVFGRVINEDDWDYYKIELPYARPIQFSMPNSLGNSWVVQLYNSEGIMVAKSFSTDDKTAGISTHTMDLAKGVNYIRVGRLKGEEIYKQNYKLTIGHPLFIDVNGEHPYVKEIRKLSQMRIINGYNDGSFRPNAPVTRSQVAVMLVRSGATLPAIRNSYQFADVPLKHSSYDSIQKLYQAGVIDGNNGKFNPDATVTRAELAKMLVKTFNLQMKGKPLTFNDVKPKDWFYNDVTILASNGITVGSNGNFNPNEIVSRQHFVLFLERTLSIK